MCHGIGRLSIKVYGVSGLCGMVGTVTSVQCDAKITGWPIIHFLSLS